MGEAAPEGLIVDGVYRCYLTIFPVVALFAGLRYGSPSTVFLSMSLPALQWLGLPDHQRRQVLGRDTT